MLTKLPEFVFMQEVETYLTIFDLFSVSLCSKFFYTFLNHRVTSTKLLLNAVAESKLELSHKILSSKPFLMAEYDSLTDPSKRYFFQISAFQYAVWALDTLHMLPMMYECIPKTQDGEILRQKLVFQYNLLKLNHIKYIYKDLVFQEFYFKIVNHLVKLQMKISAMQFFIDNNDIPNIEKCALSFFKKNQELPTHVIYHHWNKNNIEPIQQPKNIQDAKLFIYVYETNLKDLICIFIQHCSSLHDFEKKLTQPLKFNKQYNIMNQFCFNFVFIVAMSFLYMHFLSKISKETEYQVNKL